MKCPFCHAYLIVKDSYEDMAFRFCEHCHPDRIDFVTVDDMLIEICYKVNKKYGVIYDTSWKKLLITKGRVHIYEMEFSGIPTLNEAACCVERIKNLIPLL